MDARNLLVAAVVVTLLTVPAGAAVAAPWSGGNSGAHPALRAQSGDAANACSFPISPTDATGAEVTIGSEPSRIVTLAPSAAQTLWEIGAREKVVGVSQYASYLEGADGRANVSAGGGAISVERVIAQEPDLVLAPNVVPNETVRALRGAGLTVYRFEASPDMHAIVDKTTLTGALAGECEGAAATAESMTAELDRVERAVAGEERPRVLYVFFGYTAGRETFVGEMLATAGGRNVAAAAEIDGYRRINDETVVEQNPEWIVLNSDGPRVPERDAYNSTTAVEAGNVVVVDANYVSQPAPRTVRVVRQLARTFHPEAYAAANRTTATPTADGTPQPTTAATPTEATSTTPTTRTQTATEQSARGFAPGVTALAVLLAALWLRRI